MIKAKYVYPDKIQIMREDGSLAFFVIPKEGTFKTWCSCGKGEMFNLTIFNNGVNGTIIHINGYSPVLISQDLGYQIIDIYESKIQSDILKKNKPILKGYEMITREEFEEFKEYLEDRSKTDFLSNRKSYNTLRDDIIKNRVEYLELFKKYYGPSCSTIVICILIVLLCGMVSVILCN